MEELSDKIHLLSSEGNVVDTTNSESKSKSMEDLEVVMVNIIGKRCSIQKSCGIWSSYGIRYR